MQVQDIMTPIPVVCKHSQTLNEIARYFLQYDVDILPVVDMNNSFIGYIDKKQLYKSIGEGINPDTPVQKLMISNLMSVAPETELEEIYPLTNSIMPIIKDKKILGMITRKAIVSYSNLDTGNISGQTEEAFNAVYNGIIAIDREGKILIFNKAAEDLFNISRPSALNRPYHEVFPAGKLHQVLENKKSASNQKFNHDHKTLLAMNSPIMVADQVIGAVSSIQDISKLEHVSDELEYTKKLKAEVDAIIEASFDSIFVTDAKANVLSINEAYTRITGIKAEDILGKNMYDLVEEGWYDCSATIEVIETHKPVTFTQKVKTGKTIVVTGNPIFNDKGELVRILTNGRDVTELMQLKQEVEQAHSLRRHYEEELQKVNMNSGEVVINSRKSREIMDLIVRLGKVDSTVIIYGESGVGKEVFARELHKHGLRKDRPLISINCAAIPESLLESELFGYEGGAFSGAKKGGKMGLFEIAHKGTLFLDEIGEIPIPIQTKLLRVIQEKEILRIGGSNSISIDVRIITATNRNLAEMVKKKQFRQDLYYRLNVVPIYVPPLRERKEEIPPLALKFLRMFNDQYNLQKNLDEKLIDKLINYEWPGNIRELRNVIERAVVTSPDTVIRSIKLGSGINQGEKEISIEKESPPTIDLRGKVEAYERELMEHYIKIYKTSRKAAKALGVSQTTVIRKAAQYGIKFENHG
ncbi:sigma 54-interacting transcriptional regulator [Syntrophomonas curvata]